MCTCETTVNDSICNECLEEAVFVKESQESRERTSWPGLSRKNARRMQSEESREINGDARYNF